MNEVESLKEVEVEREGLLVKLVESSFERWAKVASRFVDPILIEELYQVVKRSVQDGEMIREPSARFESSSAFEKARARAESDARAVNAKGEERVQRGRTSQSSISTDERELARGVVAYPPS